MINIGNLRGETAQRKYVCVTSAADEDDQVLQICAK